MNITERMTDLYVPGEFTNITHTTGKGVSVIDKFTEAGIPYFNIDPEMIEILYILNFELNIKTKFCCYGHKEGDKTYIMFDESNSDENVIQLLKAVDTNLGTSGVGGTRLYKWARTMYEPYYKMPHRPEMNWMLEVTHKDEELRQERVRVGKLTKAIRELVNKR